MEDITRLKSGKFTLEQLEGEIKERRELIVRMVGRLYPEILECEIQEINEMIWGIKHPAKRLAK